MASDLDDDLVDEEAEEALISSGLRGGGQGLCVSAACKRAQLMQTGTFPFVLGSRASGLRPQHLSKKRKQNSSPRALASRPPSCRPPPGDFTRHFTAATLQQLRSSSRHEVGFRILENATSSLNDLTRCLSSPTLHRQSSLLRNKTLGAEGKSIFASC